MFATKKLAPIVVLTGAAVTSGGCGVLFAPPDLTPELSFVSHNEADFRKDNDDTGPIVSDAEIEPSSLAGCWGTIATIEFDVPGAASSDAESDLASVLLGVFGSRAIAIEEVGAYVFDTDTGQMEWHILTRGGFGAAGMQVYTGPFELLDGNRIRFAPDRFTFNDPTDGTPLTFESHQSFEWTIAVESGKLRLEAQGDLANPEDNVDRDRFVFRQFPCP